MRQSNEPYMADESNFRLLILALMAQAVTDLINPIQRIRYSAEQYLKITNPDFIRHCQIVDIEPTYFLKNMQYQPGNTKEPKEVMPKYDYTCAYCGKKFTRYYEVKSVFTYCSLEHKKLGGFEK